MQENRDNITINIQTEIKNPSSESSERCPKRQMHIKSIHDMNIPTQDLLGIETFNESMQLYFRDAYNLCRIFSLTMAIQLQIFEIILQNSTSSKTTSSSEEILNKIHSANSLSNLTLRHLNDLLNELVTQGFLETEGSYNSQSYCLTEFTKAYFLISSPKSMCRMYMNINRYMRCFEESIISNFSTMRKPINHSEYNFIDEYETGMVMEYFYKTTEKSFERLMELVDFSRFKRVMDVRGSYGLLSAKLKKRFPTVEFISFDNPTLESYAVDKLKQLNMRDDVVIKSGSLISGNLPEADSVISPFSFMHYNDENCLKAMKHIHSCLSSNGQLIILENLIDPERKDCKAMSMSFMMGIQNCEGNARTFSEFMALLMSAGFKTVDRMQMGVGMADIMIAMK